MSKLSHVDDEGRANMVDVSAKNDTERQASAEAIVFLSDEAFALVVSGNAPKGDVFATARIAGIMAAKKTSELIPLCHPLALSHAGVEFSVDEGRHSITVNASVKTKGPTGVEMEALTAAGVAALTIYDMIKAVDRSAHIEGLRVLSKFGGKSGVYEAPTQERPPAARVPRKTAPRVLMGEVTSARGPAPAHSERDSLRAFMIEKRLRATEWAKSAKVPVNELYGFLSGRARALPEDTAKNLARAARSSVADMLGRKKP